MATPKNHSVIRAFEILRLLAGSSRALSAQQIADATQTTLSTTHRFLLTLEEIGAVTRRLGNLYHLGLLVAELAQRADNDRLLAERARAHIEALAEELGETVTLAFFTRRGAEKITWHEPNRSLVYRERTDFGPSFHGTAIGKLYLSNLPAVVREESLAAQRFDAVTPGSLRSIEELGAQIREIRAEGVAIAREETEIGLVEVAVPIRTLAGETSGALGLSAPASRLVGQRMTHTVAKLHDTAGAITRQMSFRGYTIPGKARPRGPFPHVKRVAELAFVSGISSRRPDDSFAGVTRLPDGSVFLDTFVQTKETMENIADILASQAMGLSNLLVLEAFLTQIEDEPRLHEALADAFGGPPCAVTVVPVKALPDRFQVVMIKGIAQTTAAA